MKDTRNYSASTVQTIRGPVDSGSLGWTLSHEHLTAGGAGMQSFPWIYDEADALKANLAALRRAGDAGITSIIDLTPFDLGRQVTLFEKVAEADTGVNIICATGVYRWVPMYFLRRPVDDIAEHFLRELQDGIQGSAIRAGIIKIAWDQEYRLNDGPAEATIRAGLERTARAAARAAKAAGVPVSCHTLAGDELGTPLLDIFEDEGLDLRAVTIGHSNDSTDLSYLQRIADRGALVGLDRYSRFRGDDELARRAALALALAQAGFAEQVALGHDGSPYSRFGSAPPPGTDVTACWLPVPEFEIPWLREHGATDEQIDGMCRRSVQSTFEAAAATTS
jgi:phosphotriesterase-related protein